ncbi:MAG: enoyl-ACP reductase [Pseudolabrys sp.]|nr:enoyl-ACP reductase [Pseudolabrys sp.]
MGFLQDKKILITGMLSNRSIAYGIAQAMRREGAQLAFTYQGEGVKERVVSLAGEFHTDLVFPCDVTSDAQITELFGSLREAWDGLDGLIHSIAFAPREALAGDYVDSVTRSAFQVAHDISSYSFSALAKGALPLMEGRPAALLTLSYLGAERAMPNYNVMGLAKAALESSVRYLAVDFGHQKIRVNAISAGPIRTLAGAGIGDARYMFAFQQKYSPLGRGVTLEDLGGSGLYLCSDLSTGVTGEIHFVDSGYNVIAMPQPAALREAGGSVENGEK